MKTIQRHRDLVFLYMFICILVGGAISLLKSPVLFSEAENRELAQINFPNITAFLNGSYQSNLEKAISDQFIGSSTIRELYDGAIKFLPTFGIKERVCSNNYLMLDETRATYNCDNRLLYAPRIFTEEEEYVVLKNISVLNNLNYLSQVYYYVINDSATFDFRTNTASIDIAALLENNMNGNFSVSGLNFKDYDEFRKLFYKTDHHWNYVGSYQGYLDILDEMGIQNPYQPTGTFTHHEAFFGSHARALRNYDFEEEFVVYLFNLPHFKTYVNGQAKPYGNHEKYISHDYTYDKNKNYYGEYYGDDYAEVIFDFNQSEKENLLIISNSYSNPINELLAAHFNKTFVIDPRGNVEFRAEEYVSAKSIDKIVVILSDKLLTRDDINFGDGNAV